MGFKDKLASAFGVKPVDYAAAIGPQLDDGDTLVAHAQAIPSAFKRGGRVGTGVDSRLLSAALHAGSNAVAKRRHVSGEEGTIAHDLPRDAGLCVIAFTTSGMSLWDFGAYGSDSPGERVLTIERAKVASVEDTGQRAQGGVPVARVTFTDGSAFDYRLMNRPGPEFWDALRTW